MRFVVEVLVVLHFRYLAAILRQKKIGDQSRERSGYS